MRSIVYIMFCLLALPLLKATSPESDMPGSNSQVVDYNSSLGEYISTQNHPKSKGVYLKIKAPIGWIVKEGDRPNILKKFINGSNIYMFLIKDNLTFFSRNQSRELLQDNDFINGLIQELGSSIKNSKVKSKALVTIDKYPSVEFQLSGEIERTGLKIPVKIKCWVVLYEDKIVMLQGMSFDDYGFNKYENIYTQITNSIIFPEQYN